MSAVPAEALAHRLANNPILTSADVAPSQAALEVVSVFNAAAAQVGKETILLLRVGECPRPMTGRVPATARTLNLAAPYEGLDPLPPGKPESCRTLTSSGVGSVDLLSDGAAAVATIYLVEGFEHRPVPIQASSVVKPTASRQVPKVPIWAGRLHLDRISSRFIL